MKRVFTIKYFFLFPFFLLTNEVSSQWSTDPNNNLIIGYGLDPHICSDSAGGCYISYDYHSTSYPRWLALERLDKYGFKPWGINKRILGETPEQSGAEIIEDGEGGVIVSYIDRFENLPNWSQRVKVQRVDSNGSFLWDQTGVRVTLSETYPQGGQNLCTDGNGGCVVVWHELHESLPTNTYDIRANRINNLGEREWGDTGIFLENTIDSDPAKIVRASDGKYYIQAATNVFRTNQDGEITNQYYTTLAQMVSDPESGIVLSGRVWTGMIPKLVAQRKDSLGNNLWQEPYVEIADSLYINTQQKIQYNSEYFYYGWSGTKNGINRIAQFQALRQDGSKLFPQGSIQISENSPIGTPDIIPSVSSKTIFIWNDATISSSTIAQMYDTLGNKLWNENGIIVSYPAIAYETTTDGQGGFITMGSINNFTIVAQQVNRNGNLGEVLPIPVELSSFSANLTKDNVELFWQTATEINNQGFEILRFTQNDNTGWERIGFIEGFGTTSEPKSYSFIDSNVIGGIYKYKLKQIDFDGTFEYSNEIEVGVNLKPKEFTLYQNYPNPFNSSTTIKYELPEEGLVTLKVYDILGNEIASLVNEEKQAGYYSIEFNASDLSTGIYFYKLNTGNFSSTKKLLLLK